MAEPVGTAIKKGSVVLVSFPYNGVDGVMQAKRRPGLVVSSDENNVRLDDLLIVPLISHTKNGDENIVFVNANSPEGKSAGLRLDSVIDCTVIVTIPKTLVCSVIGSFTGVTMNKVDACIRRVMDMGDDFGVGVLKHPYPSDDDTGVALQLPEAPPESSNE